MFTKIIENDHVIFSGIVNAYLTDRSYIVLKVESEIRKFQINVIEVTITYISGAVERKVWVTDITEPKPQITQVSKSYKVKPDIDSVTGKERLSVERKLLNSEIDRIAKENDLMVVAGDTLKPTTKTPSVEHAELTQQERICLDRLVAAWNQFTELPLGHPNDQSDFMNGIHICQRILAARQAKRIQPELWT